MNLEVVIQKDDLIVIVDDINSIFKILKPDLLQKMIIGFLECEEEAQVNVYALALVSMGALSCDVSCR